MLTGLPAQATLSAGSKQADASWLVQPADLADLQLTVPEVPAAPLKVTVAAIETGSLLGGNMVVETVFGWPGLGRLVVESIFVRNYPLIQAAVLFYAVTYVMLNFFADILYTMLNPRVKL